MRRCIMASETVLPFRETRAQTLYQLAGQMRSDALTVLHPADAGERIDETGRQVHRIAAELAGFVVPRKHMMVVVPALTERRQRYEQIVHRADVPAQHTIANHTT